MKIYERYTDKEMEDFGLKGALPQHVGIIMDGNGRWATRRLMPRPVGHRAGLEALHVIVRESHRLGIKALSVYAFSTENWKRPMQEVGTLFSLLTEYFEKEINELHANKVKIIVLGDLDSMPEKVQLAMRSAMEKTKLNDGLRFCIALNYGGRAEITRAVRSMIDSGIKSEDVTEQLISENLYTYGLPELDLVIRTAGEQRLSNFLLWQSAYAEFVFTKVLWPDFGPEEYRRCIIEFMKRTRRFGKVVE